MARASGARAPPRLRGSPALVAVLAVLTLLSLLATVTGPAAAHGGGSTSYIVNLHDGQRDNRTVAWYTLDNGTEANPPVPVHPDEQLTLILVNAGSLDHTLVFEPPIDQHVGPIAPGEEEILSIPDLPAGHGPVAFWDPDHAEHGLQGQLVPEEAHGQDEPGAAVPGPGPEAIALVLGGIAGVASAVAPSSGFGSRWS